MDKSFIEKFSNLNEAEFRAIGGGLGYVLENTNIKLENTKAEDFVVLDKIYFELDGWDISVLKTIYMQQNNTRLKQFFDYLNDEFRIQIS